MITSDADVAIGKVLPVYVLKDQDDIAKLLHSGLLRCITLINKPASV